MKTFARRLCEITILISLVTGTGLICYETGRKDLLSAPPAAVQPVEPPIPVIEEEKPKITDEQPAQQTNSQILIRGTPHSVSSVTGPSLPVEEPAKPDFRGVPFFVSTQRWLRPTLPAQATEPPADVTVAINPKPECGPEPDKLEPEAEPQNKPLPPPTQEQLKDQQPQQQVPYCNCRRCRRMFGW